MSEVFSTQDYLDFRRARSKSFLRKAWALLSGHNTDLMAWDEVRDKLKLRGFIRRGIQTVPVDKIKGSVGRYRDFDNAFLPTNDGSSSRWRKINRAFYDDISLPPVSLYKVGDVYFVLDGNHRVSVAREHGVKYIDAEVQEAITRVPVTAEDIDADALELLGEYAEFLERTQLDVLRPEQNIRFSIGGGYARLLEHIAVHRYFMGLDLQREVSEDEAVTNWYDNVYMPIVEAIRKEGILQDFPGRTEADLYLWIMDHKHYLKEHCGCEVPPEEAVADYAEHFAEKPPLRRVQEAFDHIVDAIGAVLPHRPHSGIDPVEAEIIEQR
ncbi:MAG: DUF4032 domain-containing protein [Anaerolineae bacterium]|nr:DUF4032 domain-containing protein [Candidatus Roseilinea sp.]MDW8450303.1 DUF4032 domain-containing protein [Anaerolineae bacterium]